MEDNIVKTRDGSHTVKSGQVDEHYHSMHGALQESEHVFMKNGYHRAGKWLDPLNILEVGFGTGLNALLTYHEHLAETRRINYVGVEPFPLSINKITELNYPEMIDIRDGNKLLHSMHGQTEGPQFIGERFVLLLLQEKIQELSLRSGSFNLVYFDAFSPGVQPEMWAEEVFQKLYNALDNMGVLVTYSANGNVKRTLKACGFNVESPTGPGKKREITVAVKKKGWKEVLSGQDNH